MPDYQFHWLFSSLARRLAADEIQPEVASSLDASSLASLETQVVDLAGFFWSFCEAECPGTETV